MKRHHKLLMYVGGYLLVAYVYNNYIAAAGGTKLPLDLISQVV